MPFATESMVQTEAAQEPGHALEKMIRAFGSQ